MLSSITEAIQALAHRKMVVVVDDENRENEGDLIMAAEHADTDAVAFFLQYTSGFLCVAIEESRAAELALEPMARTNTDRHRTAYLVTVDYTRGTTTGISAGDRAATVRALADPTTDPGDLSRPGHIVPLRARPGGVLERAGHTEAGVDLCRAAGLSGAALLCEIVTPDRRNMMRRPDLERFAGRHGLPIVSIEALRAWRAPGGSTPAAARPDAVVRSGQSTLPTETGTFHAIAYRSSRGDNEHLALVMGDPASAPAPLVRVHSECLTGDLAGSLRCDCGSQFQNALRAIADAGTGVLIYLRGHEGRGIGLGNKLRAYQLQQHEGLDTVDANVSLGLPVDSRSFEDACQILDDLGVGAVRLMTNNPDKIHALTEHGITVVEQVAHEVTPGYHNRGYLAAKRNRLGHTLQQIG
ncbi:bifunctional 3,4-dihydroxy-2-butanone-4-phosphate synthase/GTP cyclohydrolase II [Mycolicibacterium goodii]|uniref:GTP cyclohydrolase-2 n=1 Tax=Mycolicibacterium goodii TaxID=134601 RepID=A0A0K0X7X8_MYCGD|nr:GTP cyclohydrolase [Mycolicibacterium goodii]